jgi:protease-4
MIASGDKGVTVKNNTILVMNTSTVITDKTSDDPLAGFNFMNFSFTPALGLNDILKSLEVAVNDPKIEGILIDIGSSPNGWATTREVRQALYRFKNESGKFIIAYSNKVVDQKSYYLSSVADKIYINPTTNLEFNGISGQVMFYKNALDKLGVEVQVLRHGKFKGAVEPYMLESMSEENREQIEEYTGSIWNSVLEDISVSRDISVTDLRYFADNLVAYQAGGAFDNMLVDGLLYSDELETILKEKVGIDQSKELSKIGFSDYNKSVAGIKKVSLKDKIAVIYAQGDIVSSDYGQNIEGERYAELIRKERIDSTVKAIVLRVNSPGGEATSADIIWREIELASRIKPVVVSMGDYAASGGYYISAAATKIYAQPVTITGSIGVFGLVPNAESLLKDKLGINTETVNTNRSSDFPSLFKPMTPFETEVMQQSIENVYDNFIDRVSIGRSMSYGEVDSIGQGRVWSGTDAKKIGLVDEIGGLNDAIMSAASLAGLTEYSIKELPEKEDTYSRLMKQLGGEVRLNIMRKELGVSYKLYNEFVGLKNYSGIQLRIPYFIEL